MKLFQLCSIGLLATLTACKPADKTIPSGHITLEYAGTPQSRDVVMFTLANETDRSVYFRGTPDPAPGKLTMSCDSPGGEAMAYGQGSVEPPATAKNIEVKPSERLHLNLWASLPSDLNDQKHRCHIDLTLEDGTVIKSREFLP